jgi:hypothetical protein
MIILEEGLERKYPELFLESKGRDESVLSLW